MVQVIGSNDNSVLNYEDDELEEIPGSGSDVLQQQNPGFVFDTGLDEFYKKREDSTGADSKRLRLLDLSNEQGDETPPLGLKLNKTPSFLNLVEMKLSKGRKASPTDPTERKSVKPEKTKVRKDNYGASPTNDKLKASNFPALFIKIGSWERVSEYEGDLVAKCYYAKRKLVWEILDSGLKSKIEIQWSDISAIRATFCEEQPGILEIELSHPPLFYHETNPQPRKHTLWKASSDFTGAQATTYRKHYLKFHEGTFEKHYEKLLQCDKRLYELSQKPFPCLNTPYFLSVYSGSTGYYHNLNAKAPGSATGFKHALSNSSLSQFPQTGIPGSSLGPTKQVPNFELFRPIISVNDSNSPYSGVRGQVGDQRSLFWDGTVSQGIGNRNSDLIQDATSIPSANHITSPVSQQSSSNSLSANWNGQNNSNNWSLNVIAEQMLRQSSTYMYGTAEQNILAEVNSMPSLLAPSQMNPALESIGVNHGEFGQENSSIDLTYMGGCPNSVSGFPVQPTSEIPLNTLAEIIPFPYSFLDQRVGDSVNQLWS
ncbi:hypothetical protein MRB53_027957 [Persea americana]|uniref:Uncharacterized protein n=1 Tax=Persea americana TaxID=3435 RepID=A0ACC2KEC3_PERAE|nr:hypothetical protein MRB53_027957 [Persea americana]